MLPRTLTTSFQSIESIKLNEIKKYVNEHGLMILNSRSSLPNEILEIATLFGRIEHHPHSNQNGITSIDPLPES